MLDKLCESQQLLYNKRDYLSKSSTFPPFSYSNDATSTVNFLSDVDRQTRHQLCSPSPSRKLFERRRAQPLVILCPIRSMKPLQRGEVSCPTNLQNVLVSVQLQNPFFQDYTRQDRAFAYYCPICFNKFCQEIQSLAVRFQDSN